MVRWFVYSSFILCIEQLDDATSLPGSAGRRETLETSLQMANGKGEVISNNVSVVGS